LELLLPFAGIMFHFQMMPEKEALADGAVLFQLE
jgi:hypothetical protein